MSASPRARGSKRAPAHLVRLGYKAAYFVGNAIVIAIVYNAQPNVMYTDDGARDGAVQFWFWAAVLASWVAYLLVQGSDPGYVSTKAPQASTGAASASAGAAADGTSIAAAGASAGSAALTGTAGSDDTVASGAPSLAVTADAVDGAAVSAAGGLGSPSGASRRYAPKGGDAAETLDGASGAGAGKDALAGGSAPRVRPFEERRALMEADGLDADADFDVEKAADPEAAMQAAAELARAGERACKHCSALQPARAHHCRMCDRCVHTFDHHCQAIGTCIGERNRCRFWAFLFTQWIAIAYAIGVLNTSFVWRRHTSEWLAINSLTIITLIALWITQLLVFGLWCFHTWLAMTNTTTFELATGARKLWYLAGSNPRDCDLPYSRGMCTNLRLFCCVLEAGGACCAPWKWFSRGAARSAESGIRAEWTPAIWPYPGEIERNSDNVCANPWENRYWSCC